MSEIGYTPAEFMFLVGEYTPLAIAAGMLPGKPGYNNQVFILLHFFHRNLTFRAMENYFFTAKSAINDLLPNVARIILEMVKSFFVNIFPTRPERDLLRRFSPPLLRETGYFFNVDGSKLLNIDSLDEETRRRNYDGHKGFGLTVMKITNTFGDLMHMEVFDGKSSDNPDYQNSNFFQQRHGISFDFDETGNGDNSYSGATSNKPEPNPSCKHFSRLHCCPATCRPPPCNKF